MAKRISEERIINQIELYKDIIETMQNPRHISPLGYCHVINPDITQEELEDRIKQLERELKLRKSERN